VPTITYDLATDIGRIRVLVPDRPTLPDGTPNAEAVIWSDEELGVFLALEGDVLRGAALALERTASDQALLYKVIKTQDLSTDGARLAAELRASAQALRTSAAASEDALGAFDWAELVGDPFAARERRRAQWLRARP
jgi:hypothetical protein